MEEKISHFSINFLIYQFILIKYIKVAMAIFLIIRLYKKHNKLLKTKCNKNNSTKQTTKMYDGFVIIENH